MAWVSPAMCSHLNLLYAAIQKKYKLNYTFTLIKCKQRKNVYFYTSLWIYVKYQSLLDWIFSFISIVLYCFSSLYTWWLAAIPGALRIGFCYFSAASWIDWVMREEFPEAVRQMVNWLHMSTFCKPGDRMSLNSNRQEVKKFILSSVRWTHNLWRKFLLLLLPLALQPAVGFGLLNNFLPHFPICHQWHTPEFCLGGGIQQIQLRTERTGF
jgi:hypothetical protein